MDKKGNIVVGVGQTNFNTENKHDFFVQRSIKITRTGDRNFIYVSWGLHFILFLATDETTTQSMVENTYKTTAGLICTLTWHRDYKKSCSTQLSMDLKFS